MCSGFLGKGPDASRCRPEAAHYTASGGQSAFPPHENCRKLKDYIPPEELLTAHWLYSATYIYRRKKPERVPFGTLFFGHLLREHSSPDNHIDNRKV